MKRFWAIALSAVALTFGGSFAASAQEDDFDWWGWGDDEEVGTYEEDEWGWGDDQWGDDEWGETEYGYDDDYGYEYGYEEDEFGYDAEDQYGYFDEDYDYEVGDEEEGAFNDWFGESDWF